MWNVVVPYRNRGERHPRGISIMCPGVSGYFEELQRKIYRKAEEFLCHCVSRLCRPSVRSNIHQVRF